MIEQAILTASLFLLLAFGIERLGRATGMPSVVILIVVGLISKPVLAAFSISLEGLDIAVPFIGALGLVLIVLEGALDIELRRDRLHAAAYAFLVAIVGLAVGLVVFGFFAAQVFSLSLFQALMLAVPFAVISSAVAIPSASILPKRAREFVVYESSLSDIVGVMLFFSLLNSEGTLQSVLLGLFGGGMLSLLLAAVCAIGLAIILMRIDGHIRFIPLLAGLFGLYAAGELMHLSPLIMVLLFGLALNNPAFIVRFPPFRHWLDDTYESTLNQFKVLVLELTFAVRGFFFILLGYWTSLEDLLSVEAWLGALLVLSVVYASRNLLLRLLKIPDAYTLTWFAPRGLITILLFLNAKNSLSLPHWLEGTVTLVVLMSAALVMKGRPPPAPQAPAGAGLKEVPEDKA